MKKHIMLVTENKMVNNSGGIERVLCSFANEFTYRGYETSIVCMDMEIGKPFFHIDDAVKFINLAHGYGEHELGGYRLWAKKVQKEILRTFCGSRMKFMGKAIVDPKQKYLYGELTHRLSACLCQLKPDVIVTIGPDSARIALDAKKMTADTALISVPVIPMNHIDVTRAEFTEDNLRTFRECNVTQSLLAAYVPIFKKIGIEKIEVIPNIVPQYDDSEMVDLNNCHHRIINVGRIDGALKRQHLIIEAFAKIADKYPEWYVSLYGAVDNVRYKRKLDQMIDAYHLGKRIIFEGTSNKIINELKKSDIFIFPSAYEGFGIAMTEAMSVGLPVIASQCNIAAVDIIDNNVTGVICADDCISTELEKLILDKQRRINMGKQAHRAMIRYSADKIWNAWERLLVEAMECTV